MEVTINGKLIGHTAAKTYFHLTVDPGEYKIESHSENVSILSVPVQSRKNYFVWQEVKMGVWKARSSLQQVNEATGRAGVNESKLIATSIHNSELNPQKTTSPDPKNTNTKEPLALDQKLRNLQDLKDKGLISEDEFSKKKTQILKEL